MLTSGKGKVDVNIDELLSFLCLLLPRFAKRRRNKGKNRPRKFPRWCHPQAPVKKKETMWGLCDTYLGTFIGRLITPLLDSPLDITLKRKRTSGESKGVIGYIRNAIWAR